MKFPFPQSPPFGLRGQFHALMLMLLLPYLTFQLLETTDRYRSHVNTELQMSSETAHAVRTAFENWVNNLWIWEDAIGSALVDSKWPLSQQEDYLLTQLKHQHLLISLSWLNPAGKVIASTISGAQGESLQAAHYLPRIIAGEENVVSDVFVNERTKEPIFVVAKAIRREQRIAGIVLVTVKTSALGAILSFSNEIGLIDQQGQLAFINSNPNSSMQARTLPADSPLLLPLQGQAATIRSHRDSISGLSSLGESVPIPMLHWAAFSLVSTQYAMRHALVEALAEAATILLIAAGSWSVGLVAVNSILHRVQQLRDAAQAISQGNYQARASLSGNDELTIAGAAFDTMAQRLLVAGKELRRREERLQLALEAGGAIAWEWDVLSDNIAWLAAQVSTLDAITNIANSKSILAALHHPDRAALMRAYRAATLSGQLEVECRFWFASDTYYWVHILGKAIYGENGRPRLFNGVVTDITERKNMEENLQRLSFRDPVTGLYNRTFFEAALHRLDTEKQLPLTIIIGDVNGLKLTNDAFGHQEGDKLLQRVAKVLKSACRPSDIVARWGGDEFGILMPKTDKATAAQIRKRIRQLAEHSPGGIVPVSIAIGTATKVEPEQSVTDILSTAEKYMYNRKLAESTSMHRYIIDTLMDKLWQKNGETSEHAQGVNALAQALGRAAGLDANQLQDLALAVQMCDIGKVALDAGLLTKPKDVLTAEESAMLARHAETGYRIVATSPEVSHVANIILSHHEWWNGNGYPKGLHNNAIPLSSRIIAIVGAYDEMTRLHPYGLALPPAEAVSKLQQGAGTEFDPNLVELFTAIVNHVDTADTVEIS